MVAKGQTPHGERGLDFVLRGQQLRDAAVLNLFRLGSRVARGVIAGHHVGAVRQLTLLATQEDAATQLTVAGSGTDRTVVAVHALGTLRILFAGKGRFTIEANRFLYNKTNQKQRKTR